jgi:hypothetical protein
MQNYWSRIKSRSTMKKKRRHNKNNKEAQWKEDYNLMSWTHLTLFDEYLEMGKNTIIDLFN